APRTAGGRPCASVSDGTVVRKPTRAKLTPKTGMPVPRYRDRARSIVPSPPSTTARSARVSPSSKESPTPRSRAIARRRSTAPTIASALPCVTTAARSTGRIGDPAVEVGGELGALGVDEVENELTVSLRAWKAGVYDAPDVRPPGRRGFGDLVQHPRAHARVADD